MADETPKLSRDDMREMFKQALVEGIDELYDLWEALEPHMANAKDKLGATNVMVRIAAKFWVASGGDPASFTSMASYMVGIYHKRAIAQRQGAMGL